MYDTVPDVEVEEVNSAASKLPLYDVVPGEDNQYDVTPPASSVKPVTQLTATNTKVTTHSTHTLLIAHKIYCVPIQEIVCLSSFLHD